jgi:hypothetical protein
LREQCKKLHPLLGWTGDIVAIFWLLLFALLSLVVAIFATWIRIRFLKITPPSDEDETGSP